MAINSEANIAAVAAAAEAQLTEAAFAAANAAFAGGDRNAMLRLIVRAVAKGVLDVLASNPPVQVLPATPATPPTGPTVWP